MPRFVHYHCESCGRVFKYMHHPSDAPPPERCTLCEAWVVQDPPPEPVFVAQAPRIRENAYARSIDQVYRQQEEASIERADDAAEALEEAYRAQPREDGPEADMVAHAQKLEIAGLKSGMKITDMRDPSSLREGDTAAVTPTPPGLREAGGTAGFQNLGGAIPNHAPDIPMTGDDTRAQVTRQHADRAQAMTARGQVGSYIDRG